MDLEEQNKKAVVVGFVIVFLILHFYLQYMTRPNETLKGFDQGQQIGSFVGTTIGNEKIDLSSIASEHKLTVINFWETWCGPCRTELPYLQKIYTTHKNSGLEIVGVYTASPTDTVKEMINKNALTFLIVYDSNKSISTQFSISAVPTTIVVDEKLKVLRSHQGIDLGLENFISSYLKEKNKI